jgi:hypothetical protein
MEGLRLDCNVDRLSNDSRLILCSHRTETIHIEWSAYPHYSAPEVFAPIRLDEKGHLYYINSYENAASATECAALFAENVVKLLLRDLSMRKAGVYESQSRGRSYDITENGHSSCAL